VDMWALGVEMVGDPRIALAPFVRVDRRQDVSHYVHKSEFLLRHMMQAALTNSW